MRECTLPLTGVRCVHTIVTDLAVIDVVGLSHGGAPPKARGVVDVVKAGLVLRERAPGVSADDIAKATAAPLAWTGDVPEIRA